ncbi:MAG TPA: ribokinase [Streptosporangiaceae bacterium]
MVGSVNADYIVRVGHLPQPGETVTGGRLSVRPGGKGANQAHAAARLGADVLMVASVGQDAAADRERAALAAAGVDTSGLAASADPTGVAVVLVDAAGENAIAVASGANERLTAGQVSGPVAGWLASGGVLLCSLEIPLAAAVAAAVAAAACGALAVINPAPARPLPGALLAGAVLTPNEGELARLVPEAAVSGEDAAVAGLLESGARAVVVTRGSRGASIFRTANTPVHIPAVTVDVADTVGAGDAFNGALAWSLACGAALEDAVTAAVAAGAAACTGTGARDALPTAAGLAALLGEVAFTAASVPGSAEEI